MLLHAPRAAPWKYARHWPLLALLASATTKIDERGIAFHARCGCGRRQGCLQRRGNSLTIAAELDAEAAAAVAPPASVNAVGARL